MGSIKFYGSASSFEYKRCIVTDVTNCNSDCKVNWCHRGDYFLSRLSVKKLESTKIFMLLSLLIPTPYESQPHKIQYTCQKNVLLQSS